LVFKMKRKGDHCAHEYKREQNNERVCQQVQRGIVKVQRLVAAPQLINIDHRHGEQRDNDEFNRGFGLWALNREWLGHSWTSISKNITEIRPHQMRVLST